MSNPVCSSTTGDASFGFTIPDAAIESTGPVQATGEPAHGPADTAHEQAQLMLAHGIRHDGRRYCFGNYCSVRLQDAITCARLVAKRALYTSDETSLMRLAGTGDVKPPGDSDQALMASLGVSFDAGRYVFGSSRYNRLADAVAYARLRRVHMY